MNSRSVDATSRTGPVQTPDNAFRVESLVYKLVLCTGRKCPARPGPTEFWLGRPVEVHTNTGPMWPINGIDVKVVVFVNLLMLWLHVVVVERTD